MNRYSLLLGIALCVGCGGSSNGSSNGGPPSGLVAEVAAERTFDARGIGGTGWSSSIARSGREAILAWTRVTDDQRIELVAQRFDSALAEVGERESLADSSAGSVREPTICSQGSELSAAWSGRTYISSLPDGITNDSGFVEASLDWNDAARVRVQDGLIGEETASAVACASNGKRAITWWHRCLAIDKHSDVDFDYDFFEPAECASEPSEGSYMQVFESDGTPVAAPEKIADSDQGYVASIAAAGPDQFIVITPTSIQLRSGSGELLDQAAIGVQLYERHSSVACVGTKCAAAFGSGIVVLWIFDADDLAHASQTVIASRDDVGPGEAEYGATPKVACDQNSVCVLTWVHMLGVIVDENFGYDESLAIYARAFDLEDGRMGVDERIAVGEGLEDGALIASVGAGSFLTARNGISAITLQHLQMW